MVVVIVAVSLVGASNTSLCLARVTSRSRNHIRVIAVGDGGSGGSGVGGGIAGSSSCSTELVGRRIARIIETTRNHRTKLGSRWWKEHIPLRWWRISW